MAWLRRNWLIIFACLAVAYMLIPIVVIAVFSFGDTPSGQAHLRAERRIHRGVLEERVRRRRR